MALEDEQQPKTSKTLQSSSSSSSESFPTEIVFEILSRLPVESLLRCKSVCKSWFSLISDPYFITYHLTLSTTDNHYAHHHLLVSSSVPVKSLKTCPVYDVLYNHNLINPLELDYPMKHSSTSVSIVGSCNGLICITIDRDNLFIWNPSTRKSIQLPDPPDPPRLADVYLVHGFAYDESSDEYSVVEISFSSLILRDDNVVMIYSSKTGNWKEIGGFPYRIWLNDSEVFLNRALHWIAKKGINSWIIVSLDLAKDTYSEILLPADDMDYEFGILGDSLCVLSDNIGNFRFCADVWVMKVYGVKDSWSKLVSIPYYLEPDFQHLLWGCQFSAPLCVSDDGKVLLRFKSRLIVFDSKDDSTSVIQKFNACYKACTFIESLISPVGPENLI